MKQTNKQNQREHSDIVIEEMVVQIYFLNTRNFSSGTHPDTLPQGKCTMTQSALLNLLSYLTKLMVGIQATVLYTYDILVWITIEEHNYQLKLVLGKVRLFIY